MAAGDEVSSMEVSAPKEHKFGVHELSDIVFVVGEHRFHCHKMMLAARSSYFAAMFTSDFKEKNQNEVRIDADPKAFQFVMEILYTGYFGRCQNFLSCRKQDDDMPDDDFGGDMVNVLELSKRFLLSEIVLPSVECYMLMYHNDCTDKENCIYCAEKLLLALRYKMDKYTNINTSNTKAIRMALGEMTKVPDEWMLSYTSMKLILDRK